MSTDKSMPSEKGGTKDTTLSDAKIDNEGTSKAEDIACAGDAETDLNAGMDMVTRLIAAARSSQNASDMFDEAVGQLMGINRTDGRCLDLIQRFGRLTAGQLAEQSGLTTGAVTTVIDRLERDGFARRVRDEKDRRRIFVELTEFTEQIGASLYRPMGEVYAGAIRNVSLRDMQVIAEYLEFAERVSREHTKILQDHAPAKRLTGQDARKDCLQRSKGFERDSNQIKDALVETWRMAPQSPPVAGKKMY